MDDFNPVPLHLFGPGTPHRDDASLCTSCQSRLPLLDNEYPEPQPQQSCASCGWTAPRDYIAEAVQAISVAVEACESEVEVSWARARIHTALVWSLTKHQGTDGIRRIKYRRQTYSLHPAPETAMPHGDVYWQMTKNGQRIGECWAPIDASQAELTRAARPFLRFIEKRTA